jgi:phage gp36-like protein
MPRFSSHADFESHGLARESWEGKEALVLSGLDAANETILGYFRTAPNVTLPITEPTEEMRKYECWIAAFGLLSVVGFDPGSNPDIVVLERYKMAMQWLRDVSAGKTQPMAPTDAVDVDFGNMAIETSALRGW